MSEQRVDTADLLRLKNEMASLVSYVEALRDSSVVFAYMLPAQWQGEAFQAFIQNFEGWRANADQLVTIAEGLRGQVEASLNAYESVITALDESWSQLSADLRG